ncbi:MAG: tetratricopeptide repeat protein [Myxococcales bacterium]|nr:tetratricopeptide repeat protein [Myxococcales bacterium]
MPREHRVRALLQSAETHTREGRLVRAVRAYRRVIRLADRGDFAREVAHARLGDLHIGLQEPESAIAHLKRAIDLSGGEPEYALMLGVALLAAGRAEEAAATLYDALASPTHEPDALATLAEATDALGDRVAAGHLARRAAAFAPADPRMRRLVRDLADA